MMVQPSGSQSHAHETLELFFERERDDPLTYDLLGDASRFSKRL
jgi:hypothetical protein